MVIMKLGAEDENAGYKCWIAKATPVFSFTGPVTIEMI
jgi:hypothetical protein